MASWIEIGIMLVHQSVRQVEAYIASWIEIFNVSACVFSRSGRGLYSPID